MIVVRGVAARLPPQDSIIAVQRTCRHQARCRRAWCARWGAMCEQSAASPQTTVWSTAWQRRAHTSESPTAGPTSGIMGMQRRAERGRRRARTAPPAAETASGPGAGRQPVHGPALWDEPAQKWTSAIACAPSATCAGVGGAQRRRSSAVPQLPTGVDFASAQLHSGTVARLGMVAVAAIRALLAASPRVLCAVLVHGWPVPHCCAPQGRRGRDSVSCA